MNNDNVSLGRLLSGLISDAGKTADQRSAEQAMALLDELGGGAVGDDSLVFSGSKIVIPESMEGSLPRVAEYIMNWDQANNATTAFQRKFNAKPYDGAAAFQRAMKRVFGTTGTDGAMSIFGPTTVYETVPTGVNETIQVPFGEINFSPLETVFYLGGGEAEFIVSATAPKKHRKRLEGLYRVVEDELRQRSLYKGKAIEKVNDAKPAFVDLGNVDPETIIFTREVFAQLEGTVWAPVRYSDAFRKSGTSLKRAVLMEGPNGTGKSSAGYLTGQIAEAHDWTYVLVHPGDNPLDALKVAQMYAPAVVFIEDMETFAGAEGRSRVELSKVLDQLDSVQTKGKEVLAVFTTNFPEKIDKGVLRFGRIDNVIHVAELDAEGNEKLIRSRIPADMLGDIDWEKVTAALHDAEGNGFLPATTSETAARAKAFSIARNGGKLGVISTEDLTTAAASQRDHLRLFNAAVHGGKRPDSLTESLAAVVGDVVDERLGKTTGKMDDDYEIEFKTEE